ncbi:hypothetical protein ACIQW7_20035 [Peribacillus simplex]|uniref:hypothetical protein n=1 Tax=Peribacillus simplex TaxID=1478 RepID=UPI0037FA7416
MQKNRFQKIVIRGDLFLWLLSLRLLFLKRNYLRLIGAEVRDSCGSSGTGEAPQAFTPRRLTARPVESEHLEGKSTTPHYLVNNNKVCENSLSFTLFQIKKLLFENALQPN